MAPKSTQRIAQASPKSSKPADYNDSYPTFFAACPSNDKHQLGTYCTKCKALGMPWDNNLPRARTEDSVITCYGPAYSVLGGVRLLNVVDVNTVCILVHNALNVNYQAPIPPEGQKSSAYGMLKQAAIGIRKVWGEMVKANGGKELEMGWAGVMEAALRYPLDTFEQLKARVSQLESDLMSAKKFELASDIDKFEFDQQLEVNSNYDLRKTLPHPNQPPPSGDWSFLAGTDIDNAKVDQPNPAKFFFMRTQLDKDDAFDCREYPQYKFFDWSCPLDVERLNQWRSQVISRTQGKRKNAPHPWTELEKEMLKDKLPLFIRSGLYKTNMEMFKAITAEMKTELAQVEQKKGSKLVSASKILKGEVVYKINRIRLSKEDRIGFERDWKTVANKAHDFADLKVMLDEARLEKKELAKEKKRKRMVGEESGENCDVKVERQSEGETNGEDEVNAATEPRKKK